MNDDFAGDVTTDGRYTVGANPLLVSSDFFEDSDWFLVSGFRKFYDYRITVFLPPEGMTPISGDVRVGIYDANGNALRDGTQAFRTQHDYTHAQNSGDRFLGITARTTGNYRSQVLEMDITGDTRQTSREFQPNFGQRHAGSVTAVDDADMFKVFLKAGKNYQFDLLGNASNGGQGSTLGDPKLQLFNNVEMIVEDDNSGDGTNARLFFEPTVSGNYYLNVSGNGTLGTYLLGSPNLDDFLGSTASQERLQLNQQTRGRQDWVGDQDWFRFNMDAGFTYEFFTSSVSNTQLFDLNGNFLSQDTTRYQSIDSQEVFVSVQGTFLGTNDYSIMPRYRDDFPETSFGDARRLPIGDTIGAIENNEDFDLFQIDLERFGFYDFKLDAYGNRPLDDARLTTYRADGSILETYPADSTVRLRAFGTNADPAYALVSSGDGNIGAWTLNQTVQDIAAGDTSTGWDVRFNGGKGFIRSAIDFDGDVDFHRVSMRANTWYELERDYLIADMSIRRPNGAEVNVDRMVSNGDASYFYATETGDHYLVARDPTSDVPKPRGYSVSMRQNAAYQPLTLSETSEWFNTSNVGFRFGNLPLEVYSEVPMQAGDLTIAPHILTEVSQEQWAEIAVADSFDQTGDVYVRGVYQNGLKQNWGRIEIAKVDLTPEIVTDEFAADPFDKFIRFKFSETLPAEYVDDPQFANFEELTPDDRMRFNFAAFRWSEIGTINVGQSTSSNIDMNVFKADLGPDQPALSYGPGEGRGHDVIINSNSNLLDGSPESIYQLLQAIGTGIGMQVSDSVDRLTSVMGTLVEPGLEDVFPKTPLAADRIMVNQNTFTNAVQLNTGAVEFVRLNGDEPLAMALFATDRSRSKRYSISATGSSEPVQIDLRQGSSSTVLGDVYRKVENGPDAIVLNGLGGFGDDGLLGNEENNRLIGYGGNDVIRGGSGNDRLEGGRGDDFYIFRPASDQDVIREATPTADGGSLPSGGTDVIRIEGMYDYDSIQEDLTFARLGNDLLIRLELDGRFNVNGDGIRITDMNDPEKRVEALSLLNPGGFVERISLASVFEQADASRRRFEVLSSSDDFGSLVQPV